MTQMLSLDAHPEVVTPAAASANGAPPAPVFLAVDANAIVWRGLTRTPRRKKPSPWPLNWRTWCLRRKWARGQHCRCWTAI